MRSNLSLQVKATDILAECDKLRDITLPDLGVLLEDKEGEETVIKLVDKEDLRKEREEKLISYVFPCTEILKVYGCLTAHLLKYLQA